nr:ABC transporter ATP-binding protein [Candidatus Prometheoarchaeum syntrophicum]QEE17816.1 putative ABC transporter ATP-binding protein [Candidatus Prometheoarchaeum syntrophicum]
MTEIKTMKPKSNTIISIRTENVIKIYKRKGVETSALRGLSCEMNKGEITIIMGPSGCGKTTLMNILSGISLPNAGSVIVQGQDITQYSETQLEQFRRDKISYIFQKLNLIPTLNVMDNITFALEYTNKMNEAQQSRINNIIELIGLEDHTKKFPDELSGGEQQRVALAAALAKNSDIILCDEPTGELDSKAKMKVMELLSIIKKNYPEKTIVIVSHDTDMNLIADRLLYIRDGKISYEMSTEKLQKIKTQGEIPIEVHAEKSLHNSNDEDLLTELRELNKIISDKLEHYESRNIQKHKLKEKMDNI